MITYIIRRLFLMIPTVIGISFLIFMLVALSPGGVGAALRVAGGGATEATNRAVQEAYLEDRYGLDAPVIVQYVRWLGRISPIKFGARGQIMPTGERVSAPKPLAEPWTRAWLGAPLPAAPRGAEPWKAGASAEEKSIAYARASDAYAQDRAAYVAARTLYREALGPYLRSVGLSGAIRGNRVRGSMLADHTPDRASAHWAAIEAAGARMLTSYQRALASRADLAAAFAARPFPQAGVPVVPGVVSVAWPDLGMSFARGRPVGQLIAAALPVTIGINLIAFPIIYMVAIPAGIAAANRAGRLFDAVSGTFFVALWSVPTVWAGVLAVGFLANKDYLGWFPVTGLHDAGADRMTYLPSPRGDGTWSMGYLVDYLWHVCLPVLCLVYAGFAVLSKQTRAAMLDNFNADYVRTAKAKGVEARVILFAHVFRNSLLPLITMFASIFPAMLAGSVVVERIFAIPGMGSLILEAINLKDRELILANAVMIALVNIMALLLADILYAAADPRISYS